MTDSATWSPAFSNRQSGRHGSNCNARHDSIRFCVFLNALPDPAIVSPKISRQVFEKILRESYTEVLLDDLELLREFCATRADDKFQSAAEASASAAVAPAASHASRSFSNRLTPRLPISTGSNTRSNLPTSRAIGHSVVDAKFSRALFLRWLKETAATSDRARSAAGDHPYARVQM